MGSRPLSLLVLSPEPPLTLDQDLLFRISKIGHPFSIWTKLKLGNGLGEMVLPDQKKQGIFQLRPF